MTGLSDELFELLPLVHRQRDAAAGQEGALAALLSVIGEQGDVVAADLGRLYEDWFIETCADWVVPYIGDLLGVRLLHPVGPGSGRSRALVANTLDYRRRKGTVAALEQLAYDVTGWPAAAEEYFTRLGVAQHVAHVRPSHGQISDLRGAAGLELLGGPFGTSAHTAETRRPPSGRFGIANVGLHVWRLLPQRVVGATPRPVADPPDGRYLIDPAGHSVPLFNPGTTEEAITSLAAEHHVPAPLRRRALYDELEAIRAGSIDRPRWFGDDPVVEVFADFGSGLTLIPNAEVTVADLTDPASPTATGWPRPPAPLTVAVDPLLGRIAFRAGMDPSSVGVTSSYAVPGEIGSGPYDRSDPVNADLLARATWFRAVGTSATAVPGVVVPQLSDAVTEWAGEDPGAVGVIAILDSHTYLGDLSIPVPAGSELCVIAVMWPAAEDASDPASELSLDQATPNDRRPHLRGSIDISGTEGIPDARPGGVTIDGLLIEGDVTVQPGDLGELSLRHCTIVPAAGGLTVEIPASPETDNGRLSIQIERSIVGRVRFAAQGPSLVARSSIVDGAGTVAVDAPLAPVSLDRVTLLGGFASRSLDASDCVFTGDVTVERRQSGCLRFSYLTESTAAPRRYRCQPDLALNAASDPATVDAIRARLSPVFSSVSYGDPAYGRLDDRCDPALRTGASNGAAMGAFAELDEPRRLANLATALDEYLRLGLEAGVVNET